MELAIGKRMVNGAVPGGGLHRERIAEWLAPKLTKSFRPKVTEIALCHHAMASDGNFSDDIIDRIRLTNETADQIASQLFETAQSSIESHQKPQRYSIVILENAETVIGRKEFLLMPPLSNSFNGDTEPANAQGLIAQGMRHTEMQMRNAMMANHAITAMYEKQVERGDREIARLMDELTKLRAAFFGMVVAREAALDRSAEREIRLRRDLADVEGKELLGQKLVQLLMATAEHQMNLPEGLLTKTGNLLGQGQTQAAKAGPAPETNGAGGPTPIQGWLQKLTDEQRSAIVDVLTEAQMADLYQIMTGTPHKDDPAEALPPKPKEESNGT